MEPSKLPVIDPTYDERLKEFSKSDNTNQWLMPVIGFLLCLGAVFLVALPLMQDCTDNKCSHKRLYIFITACLLIVAAIVCFASHRKIIMAPTVFKKERIFLRDLTIALQLAKELPESYVRVKQTKDKITNTIKLETEEQYPRTEQVKKIIQTLTNRYPN